MTVVVDADVYTQITSPMSINRATEAKEEDDRDAFLSMIFG